MMRAGVLVIGVGLLACSVGCERAWWNGFLDPTQVGRFETKPVRNEIRRTLGPLEEPEGIPGAVEPTREDLITTYEEPAISRGDVLDTSVFELLQPGVSTDVRRQVNEVGYITLPVLGPLKVAGQTPRQLELDIIDRLKSQQILVNPEVAVAVAASMAKRFSVVGNVARPGEFPIPRPDYRLLEVIGAIGPISQTQQKIYVIRGGQPASQTAPGAEAAYQAATQAATRPAEPEDPFATPPGGGLVSLGDIGSGWPAPSRPTSAGWAAESTEPATRPRGDRGAATTRAGGRSRAAAASKGKTETMEPGTTGGDRPNPSGGPTHSDFLDALSQKNAEPPSELDTLTTRRASSSNFFYVNGEWVEVAESAPTKGAESPATGAVSASGPSETAGTATATGSKPEGVDWEALTEAESPLRIIEVPVDSLLKGDMRYNIVIRYGDIVNVPVGTFGEYYITGHISRPGAYTLTGRDITVKEAVASAGGFSVLAWPSRCELIRRLAGDQEEIRSINLDKIFSGQEPDFYLRPNDIINVGTTAVAPFLATIRNSFRMSYGFGFVYDRNFADEDTFFAKEQLRSRRRTERLQRGFPP